jgi:hypothetical protein
MKNTLHYENPFLLIILCGLFSTYRSTGQSIDKDAIPGQYIFRSLTFDDPIDLNKNGKTSRRFEVMHDRQPRKEKSHYYPVMAF